MEIPPVVDTVLVRASALASQTDSSVFSTNDIRQIDLTRSERLDDALKLVPGLSLFRRSDSGASNPTTQGLTLRSFAPSGAGRVLVTLDGVPQQDPFGGWTIWSSLPTPTIAAARVTRGGGAGAYGAGALTGTVDLASTALSGQVAQFEFGDRGLAAGHLYVGGHGWTIGGSSQTTDGFTPVRGKNQGPVDLPLAMESHSGLINWRGDVAGQRVDLRLNGWKEDKDSGLSRARSSTEGQQMSLTVSAPTTTQTPGYRFQIWGRKTGLYNSSVSVAAGRLTTSLANIQYETPALGYGLNAALRLDQHDQSSEVGIDARWTDGETRELFRPVGGAFTRSRYAGGTTRVAGLYGQYSREFQGWTVIGTVRSDWWSNGGARRLETDLATGQPTLNLAPRARSGIVPTGRLGVKRDLAEGLSLRAAVYSAFRPPTLNELHRPFRVGNDITEANPALEPETLNGAEFGLNGHNQQLVWSATLFANQLRKPVTNVTIGVGPGIVAQLPQAGFVPAGGVLRQRQNVGSIEAWGLEADARWSPTDAVEFGGALSWTSSEVDGGTVNPQLTGKRPAQSPRLTAVLTADWTASDTVSVGTSYRYESKRFEDDLNSRSLAAGGILAVHADWRLSQVSTLFVAVDNLADARLETAETVDGVESYDMPRSFRIGLRVRH